MTGRVYAVVNGALRRSDDREVRLQLRVKVGFTHDVDRRVRQLQVGCPDALYLWLDAPGSLDDEASIHALLQGYKVARHPGDLRESAAARSEWFYLDTTTAPMLLTLLWIEGVRYTSPMWVFGDHYDEDQPADSLCDLLDRPAASPRSTTIAERFEAICRAPGVAPWGVARDVRGLAPHAEERAAEATP